MSAFVQEHGPFYELHFIGTVPGARNQGLGKQLMLPALKLADEQNRYASPLHTYGKGYPACMDKKITLSYELDSRSESLQVSSRMSQT